MCDVTHDLYLPSPVTNSHTFLDPFPWSVTYFMHGPKEHKIIKVGRQHIDNDICI